LTGEAGYLSDAGLTLKGEWSSRNYFGGARNLTVSAVAQTGVWALEDDPEELLRGSVALTQPGVIGRYVALVTSPYLEYRDDYRDRSARVGFDATLVYLREAWLRSASLQYGISSRRVYEYRDGASADMSIFDLLSAAFDSLGERSNRSAITASLAIGRQDHPVRPNKLLMFRPSVEFTVPQGMNTAEYTRLDASVSMQQPLRSGVSFLGRVAAGHLYPHGKSIPQPDGTDALERFLELRDYTFTSGGTGDVRGWASRLLGPKVPDVIADSLTQTSELRADRYVPVSGLARMTVSSELRLPFPGLSASWGTHVFLDGGKVWSSDARYGTGDLYDQERFFFSTGCGIDRDTPVGPVRLSAGWKLNPSALDVLEPQEFLDAVEAGTLGSVHTSWTRRVQVHLAIGTGF
jgi:outer membrane protein insertion porin family